MTDTTTPAAGIEDPPPLTDWEAAITMARRNPDGARELRTFTAILQARTERHATDGAWALGHAVNEASGHAWKFADTGDEPNYAARQLIDDDPVHGYFGLSYANYLVLHRAAMQSMPTSWQHRMVTLLEEYDQAFAHIEKAPAYQVTAAREVEYSDLTDDQMAQLGITAIDERGLPPRFYDADGTEHEGWERALLPLPGGDPVPHYNRGRTRIEPAPKEVTT